MRIAFNVISVEIPCGEMTTMEAKHAGPNHQQRDIARQLGISAEDLAERVALTSRTDGFQTIPAGIATQQETLSKDLVSDAVPLGEIARMLGIDPKELARRLASKETQEESTHQTLKVGRDGDLTALNVAEKVGVGDGIYTEFCVNRIR
jgi:DNA-binding Lrp family transcriptional regulator